VYSMKENVDLGNLRFRFHCVIFVCAHMHPCVLTLPSYSQEKKMAVTKADVCACVCMYTYIRADICLGCRHLYMCVCACTVGRWFSQKIKLHCIYFGYLIFTFNKNSSDLIVQLSHYVFTWTSPQVGDSLHHGQAFLFPVIVIHVQ
jgi:hypothetical protein